MAVVGVLIAVAGGLVGIGRLAAVHTQATAAADAAALAAAPLTFLGGDAYAEAEAFAAANGARLSACRCGPDASFRTRVITVEVVMPVDLGILGFHTVRARSAAEFSPMDFLSG